MKNLHNVEKSAFRRGEYVGYAAGSVWRITRVASGWMAANRGGGQSFTRRTLEEISEGLETTAAYLLNVKH